MHGRPADALPRRRLVKLGSRARLSLSQAHESHRPSVLRVCESPVTHAMAHSQSLNRQRELSAPELGLVRSPEREHNSRHLSATMAPSQPSHAALSKARSCPDATPPTSLLLGICQKASRETESPPSPKHVARFPEAPNPVPQRQPLEVSSHAEPRLCLVVHRPGSTLQAAAQRPFVQVSRE